ncbi:MAG TPA: nucleotide exchange factor GrpE [Acidimicrobiales bacterium]|nr:nucleotide exchange factor GrpE [Acidimicrobiales bacterium]
MSPRPEASGGSRPRPGGAHGDDGAKGDRGAHGDSGAVKPGTQPEATSEAVEEDPATALESARRDRDDYLETLRRVQADFENYKKRMMRQQTELLERAAEGIVAKLLPALDAFDLARAHLREDVTDLSPEGKALLQASALLFDSLAKEGLERMEDLGSAFDPTRHEAVEHEPAEAHDEGGAPRKGAATGNAGPPGSRDDQGDEERDSAHGAAKGATGEPVVVGVLRPGYRWKGRVIRPAMVRVRG